MFNINEVGLRAIDCQCDNGTEGHRNILEMSYL